MLFISLLKNIRKEKTRYQTLVGVCKVKFQNKIICLKKTTFADMLEMKSE